MTTELTRAVIGMFAPDLCAGASVTWYFGASVIHGTEESSRTPLLPLGYGLGLYRCYGVHVQAYPAHHGRTISASPPPPINTTMAPSAVP